MISDLNQVIVEGKVTRNPVQYADASGLMMASFPMRIRRVANIGGSKKTSDVYLQVRCYGKLTNVALGNLNKGDKCRVIGFLDYFEWELDGEEKSAVGINAHSLTYLKKEAKDALRRQDPAIPF